MVNRKSENPSAPGSQVLKIVGGKDRQATSAATVLSPEDFLRLSAPTVLAANQTQPQLEAQVVTLASLVSGAKGSALALRPSDAKSEQQASAIVKLSESHKRPGFNGGKSGKKSGC